MLPKNLHMCVKIAAEQLSIREKGIQSVCSGARQSYMNLTFKYA